MDLLNALTTHGAEAVYKAANAALAGDYSRLAALGLDCTTLAEAFAAQASAFKAMGQGARARDQMEVNGELVTLAKRGRPTLPPEDRAQVRSIRLTDARWDKLRRLGSEWLARAIDRAKEPGGEGR